MSDVLSESSAGQARHRGEQMMAVLRAVTVGTLTAFAAYLVVAAVFLTGVAVFFLGLLGAGRGSRGAPLTGGATIRAMLFARWDGGRREARGRDAAAEHGGA